MSRTGMAVEREALIEQVLQAWRVHDGINLYLLQEVPEEGLQAIPAASRGRTVAEQFAHMDRVRRSWLAYHRTGQRARLPRVEKGEPIAREVLAASLRESGEAVEAHVRASLPGNARIRMSKGEAVRRLAYLISHESHHRGQIMLALKQNGMRLGDTVALQGVWGRWMSGA